MWPSLFVVGIPVLAAALAAWGIWRRKWVSCVPAVLIGLAPLVSTALTEPIIQRFTTFALYVEPRNVVMTLLLVDAAAVACLVALWAGFSRTHWFWRLSAMAGVPAALSLVRANEPISLAFIVMPLIAAAAWWSRRQRDRPKTVASASAGNERTRFRWQLRDALLAFVPLGLIALGLRSLVAGPLFLLWEGFLTLAAALVLLGISAAGAGGASSLLRRWLCAAACAGFIAGVTAVFVIRDNDVLGLAYFFEQPYIDNVAAGLFLMAALGIPAAIGLTSWVYGHSINPNASRWTLHVSRAGLGFGSLTLLVPLLIVGWQMRPPVIAAKPLPPSPTYDRLVHVGERIRRLGYNGRTSAALKPEIDSLAEILKKPGHVWFDVKRFSRTELSRQYDMSFDALQHISIAFEIETARAEARGDYARSIELAKLQFQLGEATSRGGILLNWALARQADSCGRAAVDFAAEHLSTGQLQKLLSTVKSSEQRRTSIESVIAYHDYWNWAAFGWRDRFFRAAQQLVGKPNIWLGLDEKGLRVFERKEIASWRLLEARLAIELYRRETRRLPDRLDELVPKYLPQVPLDPWTGNSLIYRNVGNQFLLYCTGEDRSDSGGRFDGPLSEPWKRASEVAWRVPGYDLDLGFERRDNFWPRDNPTIMGTPATVAGISAGSYSASPTVTATPAPPAGENSDSPRPD